MRSHSWRRSTSEVARAYTIFVIGIESLSSARDDMGGYSVLMNATRSAFWPSVSSILKRWS
jgi:hypothetical protein